MKQLPSLKQLEYLVALADTEHFGKAAERCHITPSTLSVGIRELESLLGIVLAERTKRQVLMTPLGREMATRARAVLRDTEEVVQLAVSNQTPMTGEMRLGVIPTVSPFLLPQALPTLRERYPALSLYLCEETTASILSRLSGGELDAAVIALPFDIEGLEQQILFEDKFEFACQRTHPFAAKRIIEPDELAQEPLLLLEEGHCLRGHALSVCQLHDKRAREPFEATSLHTLVQMVAGGIGVTLLPKLAIDAGITHGANIQLVPIAGHASRQIGLVWRASCPRDVEFELLGDVLREHVEAGRKPIAT
jgi:LysR family transcriptional regulator, hydrogen peroxide-inducible genes activator